MLMNQNLRHSLEYSILNTRFHGDNKKYFNFVKLAITFAISVENNAPNNTNVEHALLSVTFCNKRCDWLKEVI